MPRGYLKVFQYGSNMSGERINCPNRLAGRAVVAGVARLDGYGIRFDLYSSQENKCGVTDIAESVNEHVLGVLYDVPIPLVIAPAGRRSKMDEFEGARPDGTGNYRRIRLSVAVGKRRVSSVTYVGTDEGRRRFAQRTAEERQVSEEYFRHLRAGAQASRFPQEYLAYLERQAGDLRLTES
jgi:hypothetical protein